MYENVQIGGVTQTKHVYIHITDRPTHTHNATQGIMHSTRGSCRQQGQIEDRVYTGHPPLLTLPNS